MKSQSCVNGKESAGLNYSDNFSQALQRYQEDAGLVNGPYWSMIADWVSSMVNEPDKFALRLAGIEDLIDYGICTEVTGSTAEIRSMVNDATRMGYSLNIFMFSDWLKSLFAKIMQGDRKEVLEKELHRCELQKKSRSHELENYQSERKSKVLGLLDEQTRKAKGRLIDDLVKMDELMYSSLQMKKSITLGTFFSVAQKREHFDREKQLQKEVNWFNSFIDTQANKEGVSEAHKTQNKVIETLALIIDTEVAIEKVKTDLLAIEKMKQEVSPAEI